MKSFYYSIIIFSTPEYELFFFFFFFFTEQNTLLDVRYQISSMYALLLRFNKICFGVQDTYQRNM